ncbi:MAG: hypothetical protein RID07_04950, partial [Lacipirellulaceae bacterium]
VDATYAGVQSVLESRFQEALQLAEFHGIVKPDSTAPSEYAAVIQTAAEQQLESIDKSAKVAATVLLHDATENYLLSLIRLASISNREKAIECIAKRKIELATLRASDVEKATDDQLECWLDELDRKPLPEKWRVLVRLLGSPPALRSENWHFDETMLSEFDEVRHNCVHHGGAKLKTYDFDSFQSQLSRAVLVLGVEIAKSLSVQVPAEVAFNAMAPEDYMAALQLPNI